jgi:hypothetical protein
VKDAIIAANKNDNQRDGPVSPAAFPIKVYMPAPKIIPTAYISNFLK